MTDSSRQEQSVEGFIPRHAFEQTLQDLDTQTKNVEGGASATGLKQAYNELLRLREMAYPLLLLDGDPFSLTSEPINIRLLPPIKGLTQRWLVAYFPSSRHAPQGAVQLLEWRAENSRSMICAVNGQAPQSIKAGNKELPVDLDERPLEIHMLPMGSSVLIKLVFCHGEITITADMQRGIRAVDWIKEDKEQVFAERHGWGDMDIIAWISRSSTQGHWADDEILDQDKNVFVIPDLIGRINSTDSLKDDFGKASKLFLASDNAYVYGIDFATLPLKTSICNIPTGVVRDVLVIQADTSDTGDETHKPHLLAAAEDGTVYLLGTTDLELEQWQHTQRHIHRIIGYGTRQILALDARGTLLPLSLADLSKYYGIKNSASESLLKSFPPVAQPFQATEDFAFNMRRGLEHLFWCLKEHRPFPDLSFLGDIPSWYQTCNADIQEATQLHGILLRRFFEWLSDQCFAPKDTQWPVSASHFAPFWPLLDLPDNAPSSLWLLLLQEYDWLDLYTRERDIGLANRLQDWRERLTKKRQELADEFRFVLRSLGSGRFKSRIRHLRTLDVAEGLLVMADTGNGIQVVRGAVEVGESWQPLRLDMPEFGCCKGAITALCVLPAEASRHWPQRCAYHIMLGSNRGELRIWGVDIVGDEVRLSLLQQEELQLSLLCSQYLKDRHRQGLLLSGRNSKGNGALYWFDFAKQSDIKQLWATDTTDCLRMMSLSSDGQRLWLLNNQPGQLLHFPNIHSLFKQHKKAECQVWRTARRALHALEFAEASNTVVCGGDEGLTLAYDGSNGRLKWAVHCGNNVRRIRYIPAKNSNGNGLWVLSGDSNESLLLNGDCTVQGILQHDSPASALWLEDETDSLLLGTINGQILRFADQTYEATVKAPERSVLLESLRAAHDGRRMEHSLEAQRLSIDAAKLLLDMPGDAELAQAVGDYLLAGTLASDAVFFQHLFSGGINKHAENDACRQEIVELCRRVWQTYLTGASKKRRGAFCKTLASIMAILEALAELHGTANGTESLQQQSALLLLQEIGNQVWTQETDGSIGQGFGEETLQAVQLSQLLRQWNATEKVDDTLARLHHWSNRLVLYWGLSDREVFCARLRQSFASSLVLTGHDKDEREIWYRLLLDIRSYSKSAPQPLSILEQPCDKPLEPSQSADLSALFPRNDPWHSWLANLQHALGLVREEAINGSGIAWQQQATWLALREHWQGQGNDQFTLSHGQGLLALWWPHVCRIWLSYIDRRLAKLRAEVKDHAADYLVLTWTDRWHSADDVALELQLQNHYLGPLKLVSTEWDSQPLEFTELVLPADKSIHRSVVTLHCIEPEQLNGRLALRCIHTETGDEFIRYAPIKVEQRLDCFAPCPQWQPTWQRLIDLLERKQEFLWIDGAHWSSADRKRLKQMVRDKYGLDLGQANGHCRVFAKLDEAVDGQYADWPVFSPDVALGADDNSLLESVQELLCPAAGTFSFLALAAWHAVRTLPTTVVQALDERLLSPADVKNLLTRLLACNTVLMERFAQLLQALPPQALGAWCRGEPVYPEGDEQNQELYFPSACAITGDIWDCLDAAAVPAEQIALLLNQKPELAERQRQQRKILRRSWKALKQQDNVTPDAEALAQLLLSRLTPEILQKAKPTGWFVEDTGFPPRIQLRFQEFKRCYVLARTTSQARTYLKRTISEALWLCLGEDRAPMELPGLALTLNRDDCMALLHMETTDGANEPVLRLLNRIAYRQLPHAPENQWPTAGGLGEHVGKHFAGREKELAAIKAGLRAADQEKAAAVLIVGSRRIGKTTLRQRIRYEINRDTQERLVLELDFQNMPPDLRGVELEHYFFQRWAEQLAKAGLTLSRDEGWPNAYKDSVAWRNKARTVIASRLAVIKERTGYAPLLSLDETDHLARADVADPRYPHTLFDFLRRLSTSGVCLLATSYPHGRGRNFALNVASHNATSPLHNTFSVLILGGLEPDEAWLYLRGKLAGLGVILPEHYRLPMLCLSRGIPWIVQALGKALYSEARQGNVVRADHWSVAQRQVMQELSAMLRTSVEAVAESHDDRFGLSLAQAPEYCLSNGRLWAAFLKLIRSKKIEIAPTERWPTPLEFNMNELREHLPQVPHDRLKDILNDLAPSPVVDGLLDGEEDRFVFTDNLLPSWVALQGEQA
ncbi:MAG: ATP-binding protein [Methylobacter sp.]